MTLLVVAALLGPAATYVALVVAGLVRVRRASRVQAEAAFDAHLQRLLEAAEMECKYFAHGRIDRG